MVMAGIVHGNSCGVIMGIDHNNYIVTSGFHTEGGGPEIPTPLPPENSKICIASLIPKTLKT